MQQQSTPAPRTVTSKSGMILPCTVNQSTDLNLVLTAVTVYYKHAGCKGSFDTVIRVAEAMRDSGAVVVLYVGLDGGQDGGCCGRTPSRSPKTTTSSARRTARIAGSGKRSALIGC